MDKQLEMRVVRADLFDRDCDGSTSNHQTAYAVVCRGDNIFLVDHLRFATYAKAEERLKKLEQEFPTLFNA